MSFFETRFPTNISVNSKGGPRWRTVVTETQNGWEQRIQKWSDIKSQYNAGYGIRSISDLHTVLAFFNEMRGRAHGFRYKDFLDYSVTDEALTLDGSNIFQLIKTYSTGFNDYVRNIIKPVSGTVTLKKNSSAFSDFSVDTTTGIVTLTTPLFFGSISAITQASSAQVTFSAAHGRSVGDLINFSSVAGMTEINGLIGEVTSIIDSTNLRVNIDSTSFTAYVSGGTGTVYTSSSDIFTWTGEYDIPVRFSDDGLDFTLNTDELGSTDVMLEEIRL